MKNTVDLIKINHLCTSCGICKAVCPKSAIRYERKRGMYLPVIEDAVCVNCGLCYQICPGKGMDYTGYLQEAERGGTDLFGKYVSLHNAWSKNSLIRHKSASGGVITSVIQKLLKDGCYDAAYLVEDFNYERQIKTHEVKEIDQDKSYLAETAYPSKSRYVPVSHENAVADMLKNRNKRLILVGTPCVIQAMRRIVSLYHLEEENYLFIGLFCESVMNYNVWNYFKDKFSRGKELAALHFKNKESGGWPGNVKLIFSNGSFQYIDKKERVKVKRYFKPERCLYCIDKLNVAADISLGDNYTGEDSSVLGSNTVIVRTAKGARIWEKVSDVLEIRPITKEKVAEAQLLINRLKNDGLAQREERLIKGFGKSGGIVLNIGIKRQRIASGRELKVKKFDLRIGERYCEHPTEFALLRKVSNCLKLFHAF